MSTSITEFVGRNCPLCGAIDSLDTDEARGEVACTECACVIAMGLAETEQNRFVGDATFEDVDRHDTSRKNDGRHGAVAGSSAVTRSTAVALAAGKLREDPAKQANSSNLYARINLDSKMINVMDVLCDFIKAGEGVRYKARELARHFVGHRRAHAKRVDLLNETAAACFQLAAELFRRPVPMMELRQMAPSLKDVEKRRKEIVHETGMEEQDKQLRQDFARNLMQLYIRMLHAQMTRYEKACCTLASAIKSAASGSDSRDLATLSEVDRCIAAVLLARTSPLVVWEDKPHYDPSQEPPLTTAYDSFAASANLSAAHVRRVMASVNGHLKPIVSLFEKMMAPAAGTPNANSVSVVKTESEKTTLKREREE